MLCKEVRQSVKKRGLENIQVMTYHSLTVKYYSPQGHTDKEMRRVVTENLRQCTASPKVNVLVIDEAQDMTPLYFKLLIKFCKDIAQPIQLFILGDYMQGVYGFKGSDTRYLTCAEEIWGRFFLLKNQTFVKCEMTMSYRITNQMASFINYVMIGGEAAAADAVSQHINAQKDGPQVTYSRLFKFQTQKFIVSKIKELFHAGTQPHDIFILASSMNNYQIKDLENCLVEHSIPCYVQNDSDKLDDRVTEKKIVFSSFHSVKGRQRNYVFIVGFDDNYFKYYGRNLDRSVCPNTLYVAVTRAKCALFLFEDKSSKPLSFLKMSAPDMIRATEFIEYNGMVQTVYHEDPPSTASLKLPKKVSTTPTELIRFLPEEFYERFPNIEKMFVQCEVFDDAGDREEENELPNVVLTHSGGYEEVADLNGIAIPNMYFMRNQPNILKTHAAHILEFSKSKNNVFLKKKIEELPEICITAADFLKSANVYKTITERFYYKLRQIEDADYTWITPEIANKYFCRMSFAFGGIGVTSNPFVLLEEEIIYNDDDIAHERIDEFMKIWLPDIAELKSVRITARVDVLVENPEQLWEIKCTTSTHDEHLLQLIVYAWILENTRTRPFSEQPRVVKLFNIKTNEIFELKYAEHAELIDQMMTYIFRYKFGERDERVETDDIFVEQNAKYVS